MQIIKWSEKWNGKTNMLKSINRSFTRTDVERDFLIKVISN